MLSNEFSLSLSLSAEKIICGCPMLAVFAVLEGVEEEGGGRMLRSRRIVDEKTGGDGGWTRKEKRKARGDLARSCGLY